MAPLGAAGLRRLHAKGGMAFDGPTAVVAECGGGKGSSYSRAVPMASHVDPDAPFGRGLSGAARKRDADAAAMTDGVLCAAASHPGRISKAPGLRDWSDE